MIIRFPNKLRSGEIDNRLISFVDFAPTLLSISNISIPDYIQGIAFEGVFKSNEDRKYIHAAADRFDEHYDMIRAVRDKRYKYLKNFKPEKPYYLPLKYREKMDTMKELITMSKNNQLDSIQSQWFRNKKPAEELFDTYLDPYEINNIANDPKVNHKFKELRKECLRWMEEVDDKGFIPEEKLIESFWPNKKQPITSSPTIKIVENTLVLASDTEGTNIGYKNLKADLAPWAGWMPYVGPIKIKKGDRIKIKAHRIGYLPSKELIYEN